MIAAHSLVERGYHFSELMELDEIDIQDLIEVATAYNEMTKPKD